MFTQDQLTALKATGLTEQQIEALGHGAAVAQREAPVNAPAPVEVKTTNKGLVITVPEVGQNHGSISKSGKGINRVNEEIVVHIGSMKLRGRLLLTEKI